MKRLTLIIFVLFCLQLSYAQSKAIETTGDIILYALPAMAIGSTFILGDKKGTLQFAKGFIINAAVTVALKEIIDKDRPNYRGTNAFPSGHTSTTFQSASFIQKRYGWKYGIPAYILAGFTGFSRVEAERHDYIDVVAGAIIGLGSSYLFTTLYQQKHMELTFSGGDGNYSIGFKFKF